MTVSSGFHRLAEIRFDDPQWERGYSKWSALRAEQGREPALRLRAAAPAPRRRNAGAISVAAHPEICRDQSAVRGAAHGRVVDRRALLGDRQPSLRAERGHGRIAAALRRDRSRRSRRRLRSVRAASASSGARRAGVVSNAHSNDATAAGRLWTLSEQLTGVRYGCAPAQANLCTGGFRNEKRGR